ncbi:MAG: octaprenyl diphosphate synthase [Gammaproteobacteria bacterium]
MTQASMNADAATPSDIDFIRNLIADEMEQVNTLIEERLYSEVTLINQLSHYIINSGGKRLRPALVLLSAGAFSYRGNQHINLAAIVEFIHTACLLHDDVVDASRLRRGMETANQRWGNEASVLVGDFLYSRSFQMMVEADSMPIMTLMAETTNTIAEGEVQQLLNRHDPDTTEERYLEVIYKKTAKLFQAAAQLGAIISDCGEEQQKVLADYGRHVGTAYQLIDDVLDYSATSDKLGKNIGDDLAEGKPTLPLIYAMNHSPAEVTGMIRHAIETGGLKDLENIKEAIEATGAITYTAQLARDEADRAVAAIAGLPDSDYLEALHALARFAVQRAH